MTAERFELVISPTARRQLTESLPETMVFAAYDFIVGPLLDTPHRAGRRLRPPLEDRHSARRGTDGWRVHAVAQVAAEFSVRPTVYRSPRQTVCHR